MGCDQAAACVASFKRDMDDPNKPAFAANFHGVPAPDGAITVAASDISGIFED